MMELQSQPATVQIDHDDFVRGLKVYRGTVARDDVNAPLDEGIDPRGFSLTIGGVAYEGYVCMMVADSEGAPVSILANAVIYDGHSEDDAAYIVVNWIADVHQSRWEPEQKLYNVPPGYKLIPFWAQVREL